MNVIDPIPGSGSARMPGASAKSAAVRMNSRRVSMRKLIGPVKSQPGKLVRLSAIRSFVNLDPRLRKPFGRKTRAGRVLFAHVSCYLDPLLSDVS